MADKRQDSWIAGRFQSSSKDDDEEDKDEFALPRRGGRVETPLEREAEVKKYVRMVPRGEEVDPAQRSTLTQRVETIEEGSEEDTESEDDVELTLEDVNAQRSLQQLQAPVFTKADNRGPNLNQRQSRRRDSDNEDDLEFDWEIPDRPAYYAPPQRTPTPPTPTPTPPPSCGGSPDHETPPPRTIFEPTLYESQVEAIEYDNQIKEINKTEWAEKPLTKWVEGVVVKKTQRAVYKENTEQMQEGLKVVETLTEPPLNKTFSIITTLLPYAVFAVSLIASFIAIIGDEVGKEAYNRGPDYSCLTLDLIDLTLLTCNALLHRTPWFKKKSKEAQERFQKRQQLIDNILAEALLYPAILCSVIGVSTDRVWTENFQDPSSIGHEQRLGVLDLILISFDIASLIYIYASRIYMVYSFVTNLDSSFPDATDQTSRFSITTRIFYTVTLNAVLFGLMLIHLSLQVYHENLPENKPARHLEREQALDEEAEVIYMSYVAGLMLICTLVVPIFNIVVFVLANYYYILELMIKINMHVVKKDECRKKLEEHGDVAKGIMGFAGKNVHATPGRLRDIQSLSTFQRIFFVLREWWIDLIFFVWALIIVGYCVLFYEYYTRNVSISDYTTATDAQQIFSIVYVCSFMLCTSLFALGNYHSFLVVLITNLIMLPLFFSFAIQALLDKCREAAGKATRREKDKFAGIVTLVAQKQQDQLAGSKMWTTPLPDEKPPTAFPAKPPTAFPTSKPPTAFPTSKPPTAFPTSKPPTAFPASKPPTAFPTSKPPTAFSAEPQTILVNELPPGDSPPPSALSSKRPMSEAVSYIPPSGLKSPLLSVRKESRKGGRRVQSSASSIVVSLTSVEQPEHIP